MVCRRISPSLIRCRAPTVSWLNALSCLLPSWNSSTFQPNLANVSLQVEASRMMINEAEKRNRRSIFSEVRRQRVARIFRNKVYPSPSHLSLVLQSPSTIAPFKPSLSFLPVHRIRDAVFLPILANEGLLGGLHPIIN